MGITLNHDTKPKIGITRNGEEGKNNLRLGIIGCGYVTANSHLPASKLVHDIDIVALVDIQLDQARELARTHDIQFFTSEYNQIYDKVDGVIIAVPHHLHTPIAQAFLGQGIHVLVEKPMAGTVEECELLISAAKNSNATLAVGHVRRFYDSSRLIKKIIEAKTFGNVEYFHAEESVPFDMFKASAFTVLPPLGGVLLDTGPHTLDLLLWWLGDFREIRYWDDVIAGVEANCRIEITTSSGVSGTVELSRTRNLKNNIRVVCQDGEIELSTSNPTQFTINSSLFSGPICASKVIHEKEIHQLVPYFAEQLLDFALAITEKRQPFVTGYEGMRNIAVIENCKQNRQSLEIQPWATLSKPIIKGISS